MMSPPKASTARSPRHSHGKSNNNAKVSPSNHILLDSLNAAREEHLGEANPEEEEKKQKIREEIKSWGRNLGTDTPFMDYFSDRADYSVGAFYGAHRRVLWASDRVSTAMEHTNSLEPPIEAKTRAQSRRNRSRGGLPNIHTNDIPTPEPLLKTKPKNKIKAHMNLKKVATLVKESIILEHYSTVDESAWTEEVLAGVRVWINRHTGEVSTTCPWKQDALKHMNIHLTKNIGDDEKPDDMGTGSLVYNASEFDDLERVLNGGKPGNK